MAFEPAWALRHNPSRVERFDEALMGLPDCFQQCALFFGEMRKNIGVFNQTVKRDSATPDLKF